MKELGGGATAESHCAVAPSLRFGVSAAFSIGLYELIALPAKGLPIARPAAAANRGTGPRRISSTVTPTLTVTISLTAALLPHDATLSHSLQSLPPELPPSTPRSSAQTIVTSMQTHNRAGLRAFVQITSRPAAATGGTHHHLSSKFPIS
jgi:hypothetical protein